MTKSTNKAIKLVKQANKALSFIHTKEFIHELSQLILSGLGNSECLDYIETCNNFDVNGMDKGTNYSSLVLLFDLPVVHSDFKAA